MGADARVFHPQKSAFPHLVVPGWIPPEPTESLSEYAKRFAAVIDPGVPCIIGGASFGGMIAVEMIPYLRVKACILIGSASHPDQLHPIVKWVRPFGKLTKLIPYRLVQWVAGFFGRIFGPWLSQTTKTILSQAQNSEPAFFRWAVRALINWRKDKGYRNPLIFHIHGDRDPLLPIKHLNPDEIVAGGGHVISLRNGQQVNRFISRVMEESARRGDFQSPRQPER